MKLLLEMKQTNQLKMTPQLQQSLHLLQMSSQDLREYIEQEAMENPWIDLREPSYAASPPGDWNNYPLYKYEPEPCLHDYLLQQLPFLPCNEKEKKLIRHFIFHLDDNCYLQESSDDLAVEYKITGKSVENCLTLLQTLEPAGIGARTLQECLSLQARRFFPEDRELSILISRYLPYAAEEPARLKTLLNLDWRQLDLCLDRLKSLHPKPGLAIGSARSDVLIPDIYITKEDDYHISLNRQIVPELNMNEEYKQMMKAHKEAVSFLKEKYRTFQWLKKSVEQRQWTILAIAEEVFRCQPTMVSEGTRSLSPLTRKEVASRLGIHESTVSRAVRNKVIQTPSGTFYLEEFFPSRTKLGSSSAAIKSSLQQFIVKEDPLRPLSDQKLVHLLVRDGYHVSRRTVAKYRELLNIPPSVKRKKISLTCQ
ncbi:RNA polymerase, sigma 54 subunit, RpoN/SigL [Salimicrobium salexigens]|uniref:RNA polymerase, sigma 54 subunit, RpoN/SigL n=2 Tax=Salimicrobium salexigens TaxID=908941 RepID=A0ABY1KKI4_9BACI|nr:RNA polymerase, sigma 54 subunit, RpoN/SigL [Salimicrobium salexigens]